ncbi:hypothetical protein [Primorskyibacter sp. S187A]|uniref:hypothetical protein n=1 Tax=Primorskyibacter sp. S187A TaxID=3415130 RepID=UPI003C79C164
MSFAQRHSNSFAAQAIKLAVEERRRALSTREWRHRLAGYGYGVKETAHGAYLTDLIGGSDVAILPADLRSV